MRHRIQWIDVAKGIGIILVVAYHFGAIPCLAAPVNSFYMSMFFIISGFFAQKRKTSYCEFVLNKFKHLMIPVFCWTLITLPIYIFMHHNDNGFIIDVIKQVFYINETLLYTVGPTWFIWALFWVLVIYQGFNLYKYNKIIISIIVLIIFYIIYKLGYVIPFGLRQAILGLFFYIIGSIIKENYKQILKIFNTKLKYIYILSLILIFYLSSCVLNSYCDFYVVKLGNHFCMFIISSLSGSFLLFYIANLLKNSKLLTFIGQNTLLILCTHMIFINIVNILFKNILPNGIMYSIIYTICLMLLYIPICNLINKYMPILSGKK